MNLAVAGLPLPRPFATCGPQPPCPHPPQTWTTEARSRPAPKGRRVPPSLSGSPSLGASLRSARPQSGNLWTRSLCGSRSESPSPARISDSVAGLERLCL